MYRNKKKSPVVLEAELSQLSDKLSEICLKDVSQCSAAELSQIASDSTFPAYTRTVTELVKQRRSVGATAEALEFIQGFSDIRKAWNEKLSEVRDLRTLSENPECDVESLASFRTLGSDISADTKIKYFLSKNENVYNSFGEGAQATSSNREATASIIQAQIPSGLAPATNPNYPIGNEALFENHPTDYHLLPLNPVSQSVFVNNSTSYGVINQNAKTQPQAVSTSSQYSVRPPRHTEIQSHPSLLVHSNVPTIAQQHTSVYPTHFTSNYGPIRPPFTSNYGPVRPPTMHNITTPQLPSPSLSFHQPTQNIMTAQNSIPSLVSTSHLNHSTHQNAAALQRNPSPPIANGQLSNSSISHVLSSHLPSNCDPIQQNQFAGQLPGPLHISSNLCESRSATADYLVKKEIGVMSTEPFDGDPTKFHNWMRKMTEKAKMLQLTSYEIISLMENNSKGEPKQMIQDQQNAMFDDGDSCLKTLESELYKQYGDGDKIYSELTKKLKKVSKISSCTHSDLPRLKELLRVCKLIKFNMNLAGGLQIFNFDAGMRQIYAIFPPEMLTEWRKKVSSAKANHETPNFDELLSLIKDTIDEISSIEPLYEPVKKGPSNVRSFATITQSDAVKSDTYEGSSSDKQQNSGTSYCEYHERNGHSLANCRGFQFLPRIKRLSFIKEKWLCFNCLGSHLIRNCKQAIKCKLCQSDEHPTLMHSQQGPEQKSHSKSGADHSKDEEKVKREHEQATVMTTQVADNKPSQTENVQDEQEVSASCSKVMLVDVLSKRGRPFRCYCIIDEQSSCSFIASELASKLDERGPLVDYSLSTMSGSKISTKGEIISGLSIKGVNESETYRLPNLLTSSHIPNCVDEVATPKLVKSISHTQKFASKFPEKDSSVSVMLLLGRDSGVLMSTKCHSSKYPFVHETKLGWALVGVASDSSSSAQHVSTLKTAVIQRPSYDVNLSFPSCQCLAKLPEVCESFVRMSDDELPGPSSEDNKFTEIVSKGTRVNAQGYLEMPLPFKNPNVPMPNNCAAIHQRTQNTLSRLKAHPVKLDKSVTAMQKYLNSGHVEFVPYNELHAKSGQAWWLPVFPVMHPKKEKLRLVFDSSATYKGVSLNDYLLQGPDCNNKLKSVLMGFRNGPVAISADIESMFHNFYLQKHEKDFTRFFWFKDNDPSNELTQMRAKVHIFGNRPSPAIANFGLRYATDVADVTDMKGKDFIQNSMYVDDGLKAVDSVTEAVETLQSARSILQKFRIRLHKIASNSKEVMNSFPISELYANSDLDISQENVCGALGIKWNISEDVVSLTVDVPQRPWTKRGMIATVNSLFDPLGLACPLLLHGKLIQREVLSNEKSKLEWDDPLPIQFLAAWQKWVASLSQASSLQLNRSYYPSSMLPITKKELHIFADASEVAIGFVMYLKTYSISNIHVSFVLAGSRVAPRDAVSMPRLELCAALEASKASTEVLCELNISKSNCFYYTDSQVILGYLRNEEKRFLRYISRRVEIIKSISKVSQWSYINGKDNPADLTTRPCDYKTLVKTQWFAGPSFLWKLEHLPFENEYPEEV